MLLQSFVPGCTEKSSLACKEGTVFFLPCLQAAITGRPPKSDSWQGRPPKLRFNPQMRCNRTCYVCATCRQSDSPSPRFTSPTEMGAETRTARLCNLQQGRKRAGKNLTQRNNVGTFIENIKKNALKRFISTQDLYPCAVLKRLPILHS